MDWLFSSFIGISVLSTIGSVILIVGAYFGAQLLESSEDTNDPIFHSIWRTICLYAIAISGALLANMIGMGLDGSLRGLPNAIKGVLFLLAIPTGALSMLVLVIYMYLFGAALLSLLIGGSCWFGRIVLRLKEVVSH